MSDTEFLLLIVYLLGLGGAALGMLDEPKSERAWSIVFVWPMLLVFKLGMYSVKRPR